MTGNWTLEGLTTLVYGIPELQRGLLLTAAPTAKLRAAQRAWFILLYQLLTGKDTGLKLPTLLMAIGQERIRSLLSLGAGG